MLVSSGEGYKGDTDGNTRVHCIARRHTWKCVACGDLTLSNVDDLRSKLLIQQCLSVTGVHWEFTSFWYKTPPQQRSCQSSHVKDSRHHIDRAAECSTEAPASMPLNENYQSM